MTLALTPPWSTPRRPSVVRSERVRALVCDAEGTLLPGKGQADAGGWRPDPDVLGALAVLAQRYTMALVSAGPGVEVAARLAACGLEVSFPEPSRSADLPDGAGYRGVLATNGCFPDEALAVVAGVDAARSAARAGLTVVANLQYVEPALRPARRRELLDAGAAEVVTSWEHLLVLLLG